ncbi:uncharacterized protein LOC107646445 [Arachis ipaensis]|uniref:uncharacterized protein LOC107646445 n=1 Tax=Arachis ipaensis TaxID=130454 RepID=UPI0007AF3AA5|nr:uncharacterized protein LOC107646445 [Arachis ipaensis]
MKVPPGLEATPGQISNQGHRDLKYFLELEVARSKSGIVLYQWKYVLDLLRKIGFENCKPATTSINYGVKLSKDVGELLTDSTPNRRIIGKLLHLSNTRPDISYAIGKLSQFLDCATTEHLKAVHRLLRYVKGSPATGLFFSVVLIPVSAYCFYLGPSLVTWKSKKQLTVIASSSEAEY